MSACPVCAREGCDILNHEQLNDAQALSLARKLSKEPKFRTAHCAVLLSDWIVREFAAKKHRGAP